MNDAGARKAVPLSPLELDALQRLRTSGTRHHAMLIDLAGPRAVKSESTVLQALVQLGLQRVEDALLEQAYQRMATDPTEEDLQYEEAIRRRHARCPSRPASSA